MRYLSLLTLALCLFPALIRCDAGNAFQGSKHVTNVDESAPLSMGNDGYGNGRQQDDMSKYPAIIKSPKFALLIGKLRLKITNHIHAIKSFNKDLESILHELRGMGPRPAFLDLSSNLGGPSLGVEKDVMTLIRSLPPPFQQKYTEQYQELKKAHGGTLTREQEAAIAKDIKEAMPMIAQYMQAQGQQQAQPGFQNGQSNLTFGAGNIGGQQYGQQQQQQQPSQYGSTGGYPGAMQQGFQAGGQADVNSLSNILAQVSDQLGSMAATTNNNAFV